MVERIGALVSSMVEILIGWKELGLWYLVLGPPFTLPDDLPKSFSQLAIVSLSVRWGEIIPDQRRLYENIPQTIKSYSHTFYLWLEVYLECLLH